MIVYAPHKVPEDNVLPTIFLAGSIEIGEAEDWQDKVGAALADKFCVLNPRRPDWDSSWAQSKDNPKFREQVEWELTQIICADHILFYFDPDTKSPISLLELGLSAGGNEVLVVCPEGFWRKGNVDIFCEHLDIPQPASLEDAINYLRSQV